MIKNFFLLTIRNIFKNKLYSIINISGLSIGIVCSILILLWVADETSYDSFHPKADRLYQLWVNAEFDGKINSWNSVPLPTYEALKTTDSRIKNTAVSNWGDNHLLTVGDTRILKRGYYVSEEFLEMFEFPLKSGSAETVLDDPTSIVITESLAKVLFKDKDAMGQVIRVDDKSSLKVTGVLDDIPGNSSFEFDYLISWKNWESVSPWVVENKANWGNYSFQVYVELFDPSQHETTENNIGKLLVENGETDIPNELFLHPLLNWRLYSNFENGKSTGGRSDHVQLFSVIAIFILVIACINFMNLATARSEHRAREVGIRKTLGSKRIDLILHFIGESLIISVIAFSFALLISEIAMPFYNTLVDKDLFIDYSSGLFWLGSVVVVFITGVLSGSYPAFYLSSFKPVTTLKGTIQVGKNAALPRKILVILQFGFSILLIISTIVIFKQIDLVKGRELGYNQENLISIETTENLDKNYDVLKNDLLQSGVVEAVTRSNSSITSINSNNFLGWPGKPETLKVLFTTIATEYDYTKTMGVKLLQGRDFSKDFATDTAAIIINKAGLDIMGLEDPIGAKLNLWGKKRTLIGIVDDVLMGSPYQAVKPMFMIMDNDWINVLSVRLKSTNDLQASLKTVENIFEIHNPAYPFEYKFADVEFQKKFTTITMTRRLTTLFSILAIVITGLGLYGLASYTAQQRNKEIGIRKVLGASVSELVAMMSKEFSRLVVISFFISTPIAWYLLDSYLDRYPIHIEISWWIFPVAGVSVLVFALIIVANLASKVALSNPVNSLRNE
ncbi:ABC transporter permease [Reichenbachiella sp. MALMAid0571]|uniref:ABC transporter permease n=1 Tax=Reichenbachiella sp. MALMAid0571 TaxID=3143939 RepID=UPI0032E04B6E